MNRLRYGWASRGPGMEWTLFKPGSDRGFTKRSRLGPLGLASTRDCVDESEGLVLVGGVSGHNYAHAWRG